MVRHFRVWLQSADGLIGRKGIMKLPGGFKPEIRTAVFRHIDLICAETKEPEPDTFEMLTRSYTYWKMEGRKLWFREVIR